MYNRKNKFDTKNIIQSIKPKNLSINSRIIFIVFIIILIFLSGLYINKARVSAENSSNRTKQVISIQIEKGDTLWDIAKDYITEEYNNINDYIDEIKFTNGLHTDTIHEGRYLIVPYYTDITINSNINLTN